MWMAWGPELTVLYNDAYARTTLGKKHPWALGKPAPEVWCEIWKDIGPRIERVMETGEASWDETLLLILERSGYPEETYHTFSYSPLDGPDGQDRGHALRGDGRHACGCIGERQLGVAEHPCGRAGRRQSRSRMCLPPSSAGLSGPEGHAFAR